MLENRKDCPMRHENGNCLPCGGFCTSVNDEICNALHDAYQHGYSHPLVIHGKWIDGAFENSKRCSVCEKYATKVHTINEPIFDYKYCPHCGAKMDGSMDKTN